MSADTVMTRRAALAGAAAIAVTSRAAHAAKVSARAAKARLETIEARLGGRLGVAVLDTAGNALLAHRAGERFPMCSTFKVLAVAAVLSRVDGGRERLDRLVPYKADDIGHYAPVTRAHLTAGGMSIADLCAAAIEWSDNTAANLLLASIGGPPGVTRLARSLGDAITRLDRNEPSLNEAIPGDLRDTTSPDAMAGDLQRMLLGTALSMPSRRRLEAWMVDAKIGGKRLRAGLPAGWRVGDKTGTGDHGTANVIALDRSDRRPIYRIMYIMRNRIYFSGSNP